MKNIDKLKECFAYKDGNLIWIGKTTPKRKHGQIVGTKGSHGYLCSHFDGKLLLVHRIVYALHHGFIPSSMTIDHIDGNKLNNKIANLRLATYSENLSNKISHNNKSGAKGVLWNESNKNWRVRINFMKVKHEIGSFANFDDAVLACREARLRIHKQFAKH
jgi:hypothetical protein